MSLQKIPVTILTGFLGAGKTTLIRHMLQHAQGRRLALIINEFGDIGIDGDILKSCANANCPEANMIELANGCLCCTVADDFMPAINALMAANPPPDHIIVETSGLALPKPLIKAFDWPDVRARLTVDGVIAVVDSAAVAEGRFADDEAAIAQERADDSAIDHDNPLEEVYEEQLLAADLIVLNKADLVSKDSLEEVKASIRAHVPRAVKMVTAQNGALDVAVLLGLNARAEDDLANRPSHHDDAGEHDHDDFDTFDIMVKPVSDVAAFIDRLKQLAAAHDILRIKGFVEVENKPLRLLVQGVGPRFAHQFDRPWGEGARKSGLVVIGEKGLDRKAIEKALA